MNRFENGMYRVDAMMERFKGSREERHETETARETIRRVNATGRKGSERIDVDTVPALVSLSEYDHIPRSEYFSMCKG